MRFFRARADPAASPDIAGLVVDQQQPAIRQPVDAVDAQANRESGEIEFHILFPRHHLEGWTQCFQHQPVCKQTLQTRRLDRARAPAAEFGPLAGEFVERAVDGGGQVFGPCRGTQRQQCHLIGQLAPAQLQRPVHQIAALGTGESGLGFGQRARAQAPDREGVERTGRLIAQQTAAAAHQLGRDAGRCIAPGDGFQYCGARLRRCQRLVEHGHRNHLRRQLAQRRKGLQCHFAIAQRIAEDHGGRSAGEIGHQGAGERQFVGALGARHRQPPLQGAGQQRVGREGLGPAGIAHAGDPECVEAQAGGFQYPQNLDRRLRGAGLEHGVRCEAAQFGQRLGPGRCFAGDGEGGESVEQRAPVLALLVFVAVEAPAAGPAEDVQMFARMACPGGETLPGRCAAAVFARRLHTPGQAADEIFRGGFGARQGVAEIPGGRREPVQVPQLALGAAAHLEFGRGVAPERILEQCAVQSQRRRAVGERQQFQRRAGERQLREGNAGGKIEGRWLPAAVRESVAGRQQVAKLTLDLGAVGGQVGKDHPDAPLRIGVQLVARPAGGGRDFGGRIGQGGETRAGIHSLGSQLDNPIAEPGQDASVTRGQGGKAEQMDRRLAHQQAGGHPGGQHVQALFPSEQRAGRHGLAPGRQPGKQQFSAAMAVGIEPGGIEIPAFEKLARAAGQPRETLGIARDAVGVRGNDARPEAGLHGGARHRARQRRREGGVAQFLPHPLEPVFEGVHPRAFPDPGSRCGELLAPGLLDPPRQTLVGGQHQFTGGERSANRGEIDERRRHRSARAVGRGRRTGGG